MYSNSSEAEAEKSESVVSSFFINFSKNILIPNDYKAEDDDEGEYNEPSTEQNPTNGREETEGDSYQPVYQEVFKARSVKSIADQFLDLIDLLNYRLGFFNMPSTVECIYNSTEYARQPFEMYVRKYCNTPKPIMFFGMNPGPWGMSQTGVPFGEVSMVRDWLKIEGTVNKPSKELPTRPIQGFSCTRTEISGKRFWGFLKELCGEPENFFRTTFVYNYLPQQWMKKNGCNLTPSDFKVTEMQPLFDICDPIFCRTVELYQVQTVVAIGKFCESRAIKALKHCLPHSDIKVLYLPHPSPRTVGNNNWSEKAWEYFERLNLLQFYKQEAC